MNHEDYCSYELSKKLEQKGCLWESDYVWTQYEDGVFLQSVNSLNGIRNLHFALPLYQAQKWLREEKGLAINVIAHDGGFYQWEEIYLPNAPEYEGFIHPDMTQYSTYEQALSAGLSKTIESI